MPLSILYRDRIFKLHPNPTIEHQIKQKIPKRVFLCRDTETRTLTKTSQTSRATITLYPATQIATNPYHTRSRNKINPYHIIK